MSAQLPLIVRRGWNKTASSPSHKNRRINSWLLLLKVFLRSSDLITQTSRQCQCRNRYSVGTEEMLLGYIELCLTVSGEIIPSQKLVLPWSAAEPGVWPSLGVPLKWLLLLLLSPLLIFPAGPQLQPRLSENHLTRTRFNFKISSPHVGSGQKLLLKVAHLFFGVVWQHHRHHHHYRHQQQIIILLWSYFSLGLPL